MTRIVTQMLIFLEVLVKLVNSSLLTRQLNSIWHAPPVPTSIMQGEEEEVSILRRRTLACFDQEEASQTPMARGRST